MTQSFLKIVLTWLMQWFPAPTAAPVVSFIVGPVSNRTPSKKESQMSTLILTDSQKVALALAPADAAGNPAPIDVSTPPVWSSSDDTVLTVTAAADGMSADAVTTGKLGTATISVSADADPSSATKTIAGTLDVQVLAGEAVSLGISAGNPTEK
jgi:hypothetical protein